VFVANYLKPYIDCDIILRIALTLKCYMLGRIAANTKLIINVLTQQ
jgi:hypothetical protein